MRAEEKKKKKVVNNEVKNTSYERGNQRVLSGASR